MKLYIDTIYTARPSHCASHAKMRKIVEWLLPKFPNLYVYWQRPPDLEPVQLTAFPDDPRIHYIEYPYLVHDRVREYLRCDTELYRNLYFQGRYWDADIILTNRTSHAANLKAGMIRPGHDKLKWSKRIFLIEDMPMLDFKMTVPISAIREQSLASLLGYLAADRTVISAFWEKRFILQEAKNYVSASALREMNKRVLEGSPVQVDKPALKSKASMDAMLKGERPFTMAFVGRMTNNTRSTNIFEIMGNHWIYRRGREVRCIASTQSKAKPDSSGRISRVGRVAVPEWVEVKNLPREEFWEMMKTEVDVVIFLSPEEDYSMSLMEPLLLGTPAVVIDGRWSRPSLGEDYPFFVKNDTQAYGVVKMFYDDYEKMYERFVNWSQGSFSELMAERNEVYIPKLVEDELKVWQHERDTYSLAKSLKNNTVVGLLAEKEEVHLFDDLKALAKDGKIEHLAAKTNEDFTDKLKLTFGTDWNYFRLGLMYRGYEDASVEVGHLRKMK